MNTYDKPFDEFDELFPGRTISGYNLILDTGKYPIEACRIFKTKEAADIITAGNDGDFDIYPGAVISVIEDSSAANNGLYHVEKTTGLSNTTPYKLVKVLTEESGVSGSMTVLEKDVSTCSAGYTIGGAVPGAKDNTYIYFAGVDSSTVKQNDVTTMYFNHGVVYDTSGGSLFQNSDERLKNIIDPLDVDLDQLSEIEKVKFNWKADKSGRTNIGVIAQSLEEAFPELVITNTDTGYKMVNYAGLSVIALAAVDKLTAKVHELEERLAALEK